MKLGRFLSEISLPEKAPAALLAASLAADWGIGLRVDLNFLILRLDMGMKVYDPSLDTARWRSPSQWLKKDGYTLHFGVGYPF